MSITIMEKPDSVSFDEIHRVIWAAHESTREKGLNFHTAKWDGETIEDYLKSNEASKCFVAMDNDKVVGTSSCFVVDSKTRFFKGRYLKMVLSAILPEYKGQHIYSNLYKYADEYAKELALDGLTSSTAEKNDVMIRAKKKEGYTYVDYYYSNNMNCYCVGAYKPFSGLEHSIWYYKVYFELKKIKVRLKHLLKR